MIRRNTLALLFFLLSVQVHAQDADLFESLAFAIGMKSGKAEVIEDLRVMKLSADSQYNFKVLEYLVHLNWSKFRERDGVISPQPGSADCDEDTRSVPPRPFTPVNVDELIGLLKDQYRELSRIEALWEDEEFKRLTTLPLETLLGEEEHRYHPYFKLALAFHPEDVSRFQNGMSRLVLDEADQRAIALASQFRKEPIQHRLELVQTYQPPQDFRGFSADGSWALFYIVHDPIFVQAWENNRFSSDDRKTYQFAIEGRAFRGVVSPESILTYNRKAFHLITGRQHPLPGSPHNFRLDISTIPLASSDQNKDVSLLRTFEPTPANVFNSGDANRRWHLRKVGSQILLYDISQFFNTASKREDFPPTLVFPALSTNLSDIRFSDSGKWLAEQEDKVIKVFDTENPQAEVREISLERILGGILVLR